MKQSMIAATAVAAIFLSLLAPMVGAEEESAPTFVGASTVADSTKGMGGAREITPPTKVGVPSPAKRARQMATHRAGSSFSPAMLGEGDQRWGRKTQVRTRPTGRTPGRPKAARPRVIVRTVPPAPQGHERVYQETKSWNPASVSFVEARDSREAQQRRAADAREAEARQRADAELAKKADASLLWLAFGIVVVVGGGLLVYLPTIRN